MKKVAGFQIAMALLVWGGQVQAQGPSTEWVQSQTEILKKEAELQAIAWEVGADPAYAPFVLFCEKIAGATGNAEGEKIFGPPLTALAKTWTENFAAPLQLRPDGARTHLPIALVVGFDNYRRLVERRFPQANPLPSVVTLEEGMIFSYAKTADFESKMARKDAIVSAAAAKLLAQYLPNTPGKRCSAWTQLALLAYLGEIHQKSGGKKGTYYAWAEIPDWRQSFPQIADRLNAMNVPLPGLKETIALGSMEEMEAKSNAFPLSDPQKRTEAVKLYRDYVQLSGYSLVLFFRSKAGEPYLKNFLAFLKADLQGEGGGAKFTSIFGAANLTALEKAWEEFCEFRPLQRSNAPPPIAGKGPSKPAATLPPPVPLDLHPQTPLDLRAEIVARVRTKRYLEAQALLKDPGILSQKELAAACTLEAELFASADNLYRILSQKYPVGSKLPSSLGPSGEIASVSALEFSVKEKSGVKTHRWTDLDLRAVANHLYYEQKYKDPNSCYEVGVAMALGGEPLKAKKMLQLAAAPAGPADAVKKLLDRLPEYDAAAKEASAREEIEKLAKFAPLPGIEAIRKLAAQPAIRTTQTWNRSIHFLRGLAAQGLVEQFPKEGVKSLFRSQAAVDAKGQITLHYPFAYTADLGDWTASPYPALKSELSLKKSVPGAAWKVESGALQANSPGSLFHNSSWVGDIAVEYTVHVGEEEPKDTSQMNFMAAVCDNGQGHFLGTWNFAGVLASTASKNANSEGRHMWQLGAEYKVALHRIGDRVSVLRDGEETGVIEENTLKAGRVFLFAYGPVSYAIKDIKIVGTLDPAWLEEKKVNWVQKELATLFEPPR